MEEKLKKKLNEARCVQKMITTDAGSFDALLIAAVLVLAAEVEDVKDEVRKLGDIVSTK